MSEATSFEKNKYCVKELVSKLIFLRMLLIFMKNETNIFVSGKSGLGGVWEFQLQLNFLGFFWNLQKESALFFHQSPPPHLDPV